MSCSSCNKTVIQKITNIVKGNVSLVLQDEKGNELSALRKPICLACPFKANLIKVNQIQYYYCPFCDCPIDTKVRVENEFCPKEKW